MAKIKIYTIPTCEWCKKLKIWLKRKKLSFEEYDLTESDKARDEVLDKTGQLITPTIDVDGKMFIGFDEKILLKALETSKKNESKEEEN